LADGGQGNSEIVHAPNLKNKIGAESALILSLRNSGEKPTHRIIRSDGKIGGFSAAGGIRLKEKMLELEARKEDS